VDIKETNSHDTEKIKPSAGRTVKLKTLVKVLVGLVVLATALMYYIYGYLYNPEKPVSVSTVPLLNNFVRPRFLFNIYGAAGVKLVKPMAVFYDDKDKRIYISSTESHTVEVFKYQGEHVLSFGGFGSEPGKLSFPYGIARTRSGDILVAEPGNGRIQKFSAKGEYLGTVLKQPNEFKVEKPGPLYVDSEGKIYIGDISGGKVLVIDEQGKFVNIYYQAQYPHGIAVDEKNKRLYVADSAAAKVLVYSLTGGKKDPVQVIDNTTSESGQANFGIIRGIALDKQGRLYVVNSLAGNIKVFDEKGNYSFGFGSLGNDDGAILYPNGIDVDDNGRIYIADWGNNRVGVWGY